MAERTLLTAGKGFSYDPSPQRTDGWYKRRLGKRSASRLEDWLSVSKAAKTLGQPLKKRLDYEKELLFEQTFNVSYNNYVSQAMEDGINLESFAINEYAVITKTNPINVGCWYNEYFVASPDGAVGDDGLVEAKVLRDNSFSDLIVGSYDKDGNHIPALSEKGVLSKFWKQMQGQLWASGREWCDFVAINMNTQKIYITRVYPDKQFHQWLEVAVPEPLSVLPVIFDSPNLHGFTGDAPEYTELPEDKTYF